MTTLDQKALLAAFRVNHHPDAEPLSVELDKLSKSIRAYLAALPSGEVGELVAALDVGVRGSGEYGGITADDVEAYEELASRAATALTSQTVRIAAQDEELAILRNALNDCADEIHDSRARIAALEDALGSARQQLVTLGGEVVEVDDKIVSDAIQAAVLSIIDTALSRRATTGGGE